MQLTRVLACAALLAATAGAFAGAATVQTPSKRQELKLLYVMEYDCMFDWELVSLEPKLTDGVLAWMLNLHDRLTVTSETPLGEELMIPMQWWVPAVAEPARTNGTFLRDVSLKDVIQIQLNSTSDTVLLPKYLLVVYQLSMVPNGPSLDDLFVTTVKTFWEVVEASAEADKLVSRTHESEAEVELLRDFVVAIPTMNAVHGQDSWQGQHVSEKYADHSAWDVHDIVAMLRRFFAVSEALSLPDLAEYEWRLDKLIMHDVFQNHYLQDPENRFPHIPSIPVTIPVDHPTQHDLCYTARYVTHEQAVSPKDVRATAAALLHAVQELEPDKDAQSIQSTNQENTGRPVRKYFIKRNYSACAKNVLTFTLRSRANWQPSVHSTPHPSCSSDTHSTPASASVGNSHNLPNTTSSSAVDNCQYHSGSPTALGPRSDSVRGLGHEDIRAQHNTRTAATAGSEDLNLDLDDALHDAQQLIEAAERIVKESCREQWLLQPFIPDMERNEYRVYLVGGADAKGGSNDTAVVYTPAFHEYDEEGQRLVWVWNITLPMHFFSRAPMDQEVRKPWLLSFEELADDVDFNSTGVEQYQVGYFPYPIWRDEGMHSLIVDVALDAADAIAQSDRFMRMGRHVMLRVDIALTRQGRLAKPFISEAHVFNDAGLSFDVWPPITGSLASDAHTQPPATHAAEVPFCASGLSSDHDRVEHKSCLADGGIDGVCSSARSNNNISIGTAAANVGVGTGMSRGYLLASKLWEEAIATANAVDRSDADLKY